MLCTAGLQAARFKQMLWLPYKNMLVSYFNNVNNLKYNKYNYTSSAKSTSDI